MASKNTVPMFDPANQRVVNIPVDEVAGAESEGLTLETESSAAQRDYANRAGVGQALLAAAEGVGSGLLTPAVFDAAAAKLGGSEYLAERRLRDEHFSAAHALGEVTGMVAPALLSGGSSAAARVAAATPAGLIARGATAAEHGAARLLARTGVQGAERGVLRSALERAAGFGAAGAVEGAVYGASSALSEDILAERLGGFEDAAERAWAGATGGALWGMLGGAGLGAAAGAAEVGARRLGKVVKSRFASSADELAGAANERALKIVDAKGTHVKKLGIDKAQQLGEDLRTYQLKDGTPVMGAADNVDDIAPRIRQAKEEVTSELAQLRAKVAQINPEVDAIAYLRRVDDEVVLPLVNSPSPSVRRFGKRVMSELDDLVTRAADETTPVRYSDMLRQQEALKMLVYPKRKGLQVPKEWVEHLQRSERILEDTMQQTVEQTLSQVSPADVGRYAAAKRLSESFIKLDQIASDALERKLGNRAISLTDYMTGLGTGTALFDGGMSAVAGIGMSIAHKVARERGSALLATLFNRANTVDEKVSGTIAALFNKAQSAVANDTKALPKSAFSRVTEKLAGVPEKAAKARRAATGVAAGAMARGNAQQTTAELLRAVENERPEDVYQQILTRAERVVQGGPPGPMNIDEAAPKVAHAMRATQQRAAAHLLSVAPVPPKRNTNPNLGAMTGDRTPDPVSLYEFARRVRALQDPTSILDDLKNNNLNLSAVESVKAVYPRLFMAMRAQVLEKLGESEELLAYEDRVKIGLVFDLPTDQTLEPQAVTMMQSIYIQQQAPGQQQASNAGATAKSRRSGSENITLGDST